MSVTTSYQSILSAVDFEALAPNEQEEFLLELNSLVFRGAVLRTVEHMDEATRQKWYDLVSTGAKPEELERFLTRRVPYADAALAETIETLADDILAVTA